LFAALFALLVIPAVAQNYAYVPDNNPGAGSNNIWPFNMSSTTGRYIQILDVKFLPQKPVKITEIAYSRWTSTSYPPTFYARQFQVRMSHCTSTCPLTMTFAHHMAPCPTNLIDTMAGFTYNCPTISTWVDLGTVADFGYDGKRHICLETRFRYQDTNQGFACWADGAGTPRLMSKLTTIDNYAAATGSSMWCNNGLKVRLTWTDKHVLLAPDTIQIGSSGLIYMYGLPGGHFYQLAASFGQGGVPMGPCTVFLDPDSLMFMSLLFGPPLFVQYSGVVPAPGVARAQLTVPAIKALVGLCIYHGGVTFTTSGITGCTNSAGSQLIP